ncbi:M48 family metallopeptidase [Ralstonia sp. R-29]|uniref:M48 family metallopeptidase n=1 Tax=Ralstonia sp. R-29 TaxID=3404059 RepID=UPI003CF37957
MSLSSLPTLSLSTLRATALTVAAAAVLTACAGTDMQGMTQAGSNLFQAASLSDNDVRTLSQQSCAQSDAENKIAPAKSTYTKRLAGIVPTLQASGIPIDAKVYMTPDINAWAMANGCVRVYSGLMDKMTDDEVRAVLGHEIGHVALGHSKNAMQVAYATQAARGALAASGNGAVAALSSSQMGALSEAFVNAQFSQSQETAADDYSFDLLTRTKSNRRALVTAFQKLAKLDGGKSAGLLSSHPGSQDRADRVAAKLGNSPR